MTASLLQVPTLVVEQRRKLFELNNQYRIFDTGGTQIGVVEQVGQSFLTLLARIGTDLDVALPVTLQVLDAAGSPVLSIHKPWFSMRLSVSRPDGTAVGSIHKRIRMGKARFSLLDATGNQIGEVRAENWRAKDFAVYDGSSNEVARVTKKWRGLATRAVHRRRHLRRRSDPGGHRPPADVGARRLPGDRRGAEAEGLLSQRRRRRSMTEPAAAGSDPKAVTWGEFAAQEPELAAFGARLLGVRPSYLATIRPSGRPRVHPVTPIFCDSGLYLFMEPTSPKGKDIDQRGWFAMHNGVPDNAGTGGEFFLSGRGRFVGSPDVWSKVAEAATYEPASHYVLYELLVSEARARGYGDTPLPERRSWRA